MQKSILLMIATLSFFPLLGKDALERIWTDAYTSGELHFEETSSGMGASLGYTKEIRSKLPDLLKKYGIHSILDIGCGDFNWMKSIVPKDCKYIGVDIVKSVIDENNIEYGSDICTFVHLDARKDNLPKADLVVCRDVLAHLSYEDAFSLLRRVQESESTYILLTTYNGSSRRNKNLTGFRLSNYLINIAKDPFLFTCPLQEVSEKYSNFVSPDKCFALLRIADMNMSLKSAVTYLDDEDWGGRLGDKLLMYVKAKWVSYKYNLPFFYKPFKYSDSLMMHELDEHWNSRNEKNYLKVDDPYKPRMEGSIRHKYELNKVIVLNEFVERFSSKLHVINYYFMPTEWGDYQEKYDSQDVTSWKGLFDDQEFRNVLRKTIALRDKIKFLEVPKDRISVAVHVRKGGGFDSDLLSLQLLHQEALGNNKCYCAANKDRFTDKAYSVKFPPDQFYVEHIRKLSEYYKDSSMYVHIFTDDLNPGLIAERYEKALNKKNIMFGYRKSENAHDKNILQDLFDMTQFECLIRSGSNFPQVAQLIGNFKVVIYPRNAEWCNYLNVYDAGYIYQ